MPIHTFVVAVSGWHLAALALCAVAALAVGAAALGHGLAVMRQVGDLDAREREMDAIWSRLPPGRTDLRPDPGPLPEHEPRPAGRQP